MAMLRWLLAAIVLITCVGCTSEASSRASEVAAATPCAPAQCRPVAEIKTALGIQPVEPTTLPTGFHMTKREVLVNQLPPPVRQMLADQQGVPLASIPESVPTGLNIEFRFGDSNYVPAIFVFEQKGDTDAPTLELARPNCGEKIQTATGPMLYGMGKGSIDRGPTPGAWLVCPHVDGTDPKAHVAFFVQDNVMVQIRAFPEANIDRETFLRMASSFRPAQ